MLKINRKPFYQTSCAPPPFFYIHTPSLLHIIQIQIPISPEHPAVPIPIPAYLAPLTTPTHPQPQPNNHTLHTPTRTDPAS